VVSGREGGPAPGWYAEPGVTAGVRWWDGGRWTDHRLPTSADPVHGSPTPPQQVNGTRSRPHRALRIVAGLMLLGLPVDLVIFNWTANASEHKSVCSASLPSYQSAVGRLVPLVFIVVSLVCLTLGIAASVDARTRSDRLARDAGHVVVLLSVLGLVLGLIGAATVWIILGFSTWCF